MVFLMYSSKGVLSSHVCVYVYIEITSLTNLLLQETNRFVLESDQSFDKENEKNGSFSILRSNTDPSIIPICSLFLLMPPPSHRRFPHSHLRWSLLLSGEHATLQSSPVFSVSPSQQRYLPISSSVRPPCFLFPYPR